MYQSLFAYNASMYMKLIHPTGRKINVHKIPIKRIE